MLDDISISDFLAQTASGDPVPGGGSISALAAAAAAALAGMVAKLTIGRKGFEQEESRMDAISVQVAELRKKLLKDISRDAESFEQVMAARRLAKTTEEEIIIRERAVEEALKRAALIPLGVARDALAILEMSEIVVQKGNPNAVTDGAVSAMMARTAVLGALYNVKINLSFIRDKAFAADLTLEIDDLKKRAIAKEKSVLVTVGL